MQVAIALFDGVTAMDAVGPYQVYGVTPWTDVVFVGERKGVVEDDMGQLGLTVEATFDEVPSPHMVLVPGGPGIKDHLRGGALRDWLVAADRTSMWTTSVCTGSLLLAATGLITGRRATTHWMSMDVLDRFGVVPSTERVVFDGKYVSAGGISAGIDMAITLVGKICGDLVGQSVQLGIAYDPQPPYDTGSPDKAPDEAFTALGVTPPPRREFPRAA